MVFSKIVINAHPINRDVLKNIHPPSMLYLICSCFYFIFLIMAAVCSYCALMRSFYQMFAVNLMYSTLKVDTCPCVLGNGQISRLSESLRRTYS